MSLNVTNLDSAIAIMLRADAHNSVNMVDWQSDSEGATFKEIGGGIMCETEEALHACGNKACFAGHLAVAPEFIASGGSCEDGGIPVYKDHLGVRAVAEWLGVPYSVSKDFVHGDCLDVYVDTNAHSYSRFYNKLWGDVKASDVLEKLYALKKEYLDEHPTV